MPRKMNNEKNSMSILPSNSKINKDLMNVTPSSSIEHSIQQDSFKSKSLLRTITPTKLKLSSKESEHENKTSITPTIRTMKLETKVITPIKELKKEKLKKGQKLVLDIPVVSDSTIVSVTPVIESSEDVSEFTGVPRSKTVVDPKVRKVYKIIQKSTGALGGNGYNGAIYGELTITSMQKIIDILVDKCELTSNSRFIDVGAGLGKPNFHAAQYPGVRVSLGVELEEIRWQLSMYNLHKVLTDNTLNHTSNFIASDIDVAESTDPFTHIYMYDLGFPPPLQQSIARKFNSSVHAKYLISYRPPHRVIDEYLYAVEFIDRIPTAMHGSGEIHTAYIYRRTNDPAKITSVNNKIRIPGRAELKEADEVVVCDKLFEEAILLAVGSHNNIVDHVQTIADNYLASSRSKRDRKPRATSV